VAYAAHMRAYTRTTPCFISAGKKRSTIERYQDRYHQHAHKPSLYQYIDAFISLLPEELVTGKAKRRWIASKRELASDHPDAAELYGESDEEEAEEGSQQGEDEDLLEADDEGVMDDEVEYEVFSDDDAGDDDDGGYDGTCNHQFDRFPCVAFQVMEQISQPPSHPSISPSMHSNLLSNSQLSTNFVRYCIFFRLEPDRQRQHSDLKIDRSGSLCACFLRSGSPRKSRDLTVLLPFYLLRLPCIRSPMFK